MTVMPKSRDPIRGHYNGYIVTGLAGNLEVGDVVEIIVTDDYIRERWKCDHKIVKLYHTSYFAEPVEEAEVTHLPKAPKCCVCGRVMWHPQQHCFRLRYCCSKADAAARLSEYSERLSKMAESLSPAGTPSESASASTP